MEDTDSHWVLGTVVGDDKGKSRRERNQAALTELYHRKTEAAYWGQRGWCVGWAIVPMY